MAMAVPAEMFLANTLIILWSARGVEKRVDSLERRFESLHDSQEKRFESFARRFESVSDSQEKRFESLHLDVREIRADIKLLTGKVYEIMSEKR